MVGTDQIQPDSVDESGSNHQMINASFAAVGLVLPFPAGDNGLALYAPDEKTDTVLQSAP